MSRPKRCVAPQMPVKSGVVWAEALAATVTHSARMVHTRVLFMVVPMRHIPTADRWLLTSTSEVSSYLLDGLHDVPRLSLYHVPLAREAAVV